MKRRRHGTSRGRKALLGLTVLFAAAAIGALSAVGYVVAIAAGTPSLSERKADDKGTTSEVFAADGSRLGFVQSDEVRTPIAWEDMPMSLRRATVAIEDERFYEHEGVDFESIVRAGVKNLESGETIQGGSTITQQLVRALYIKDPERNFKRKIREAKLASELEDEHDKRWILREYLNSVPYGTVNGRTALGVQAAAETYFSKAAEELTLSESALLAGLPQAPSQYNPFRNRAAALERRNEVLAKMAEQGYISPARAERAAQRGLGLRAGDNYTKKREPYFFDYVEEKLIEKYGAGEYRRGGFKIYTTIDPKLQKAGREAINSTLNQTGDPSSAVVAIDPSNGYIRAMASSGTYGDRTFNLAAQGHRQPGSAFKTFVLTTAVRRGVDPRRTSYVSRPFQATLPGFGVWKVKTYDNSYLGRTDLVRATLRSDNAVYAQLDLDLGPKEVRETAKLMGITTKLDAVPSEGLGGLRLGVSPLEIANAYATLASGGMRNEPIAIERVKFPDGKVDDSLGKVKRKRVLTDGETSVVTKILEQNVQAGTGTKAQIGCPAAGKTGTTDNFNDAWFVGYTPSLAASVWVGYPNALKSMRGVHGINVAGGTFPAQIWGNFMRVAKGADCKSFPAPTTPVKFSPFVGKYAKSGGSYTKGRSSYRTAGGGGGTSAGGKAYRGYDPRLYEAPPQEAPGGDPTDGDTEEPSEEAPAGGDEPRRERRGGPPRDGGGGGGGGGGTPGGGVTPE